MVDDPQHKLHEQDQGRNEHSDQRRFRRQEGKKSRQPVSGILSEDCRDLYNNIHRSFRCEEPGDPAAAQKTQGDGKKLHDTAEDSAGMALFSFIKASFVLRRNRMAGCTHIVHVAGIQRGTSVRKQYMEKGKSLFFRDHCNYDNMARIFLSNPQDCVIIEVQHQKIPKMMCNLLLAC